MTYYAVMKLVKSMSILNDDIVELKEGQYVIPVFVDYEEALDHSDNGKFEILTLSKEE